MQSAKGMGKLDGTARCLRVFMRVIYKRISPSFGLTHSRLHGTVENERTHVVICNNKLGVAR